MNMNEYRDPDELGGLRHAVDGISPDVDALVAGGLSRGRRLAQRAATRKRMVTFGGPALAAAAVVGVLLTGALSGGNPGAATGVAAVGGAGSPSATHSQPSPKTKSVTPPPTTARSVTPTRSVTPPPTKSVTPPPIRSVTKYPTTLAAQPNAPIDIQGLPSPSTPAAVGAFGALQHLLPAGGSVVDPRVFPKDALALAATYTRAGQSAQVTVAVFTADQAGGPAVCISGSDCVVTTLSDGSRQLLTTYSSKHWEVTIDRTDGTSLTVSAVQAGEAGGMPLTEAQLIELARNDRWTHLGN